jgi:hypothetical protein
MGGAQYYMKLFHSKITFKKTDTYILFGTAGPVKQQTDTHIPE